jgi:hypothetical protein
MMASGFTSEQYQDLLHKVYRELTGLIAEVEAETVTNVVDPPAREIVHDVIPLLRKLKDAQAEARLAAVYNQNRMQKVAGRKKTSGK